MTFLVTLYNHIKNNRLLLNNIMLLLLLILILNENGEERLAVLNGASHHHKLSKYIGAMVEYAVAEDLGENLPVLQPPTS